MTAIAGYDALSHAVESFVTTKRNAISDLFARDAWRRLDANYERVLAEPDDLGARGAMLLGAHEAGIAIEQSMLGATHACANPLTARYGTTHGVAIGVMLPHVVRWNAQRRAAIGMPSCCGCRGRDTDEPAPPGDAAGRRGSTALARAGGLPRDAARARRSREDLPALGRGRGDAMDRHLQSAAVRCARPRSRLYERAYYRQVLKHDVGMLATLYELVASTARRCALCEDVRLQVLTSIFTWTMRMNLDVVVIGGGPAGSTVSTLSPSTGYRVELFEREHFPRFHIGESLIPETYWVLKRLNMLPKMQQSHFVKKYSVQFVNAAGKLSAPFYFWDNKPHECSQTWQVVRSEFDQMMLDNAREHGVDVHEGVRVRRRAVRRRQGASASRFRPRAARAATSAPRSSSTPAARTGCCRTGSGCASGIRC